MKPLIFPAVALKIRRKTRSGFSLVITLMLMVLLTIVALGMLSLATITLRSADAGNATATARANARVALMMAIGDLQKYAGPDQRVTAPADIIPSNTSNTRWTGVWSTTKLNTPTTPVVGGYADPNYLIDLRSSDTTMMGGAWKNSLRLGWLVSGAPTALPTPGSANNTIALVDKGTLGTGFDAKDGVKVPAVLVGTGGPSAGAYAYWVGDESQKARIDQGTPYTKSPNLANLTDGGYYRLAGADGPGFAKVRAGSSTPYSGIDSQDQATRQKMLSRQTVALGTASTDAPKKNFHDVTTSSQSVLADVRNGGLKKDLTAYVESPSGVPSVTGYQETGLATGAMILPGVKYQTMGPSFGHLKNWYGLRSKVTGALGSATIVPQYLPTRAASVGNPFPSEGYSMDLTKGAQSVHPVLASARMAYDTTLDTSRGGGRAIRFHVYPRVTLWNPYNVTLKGARYLVGMSFNALNQNSTALKDNGDGTKSPEPGFTVGNKFMVKITDDASVTPGEMYAGIGSEHMVYFALAPIDMAPGECLVFSPDYANSTGLKLGGNANQYVAGDIGANVLSASIPTGQNNFYFNSEPV